MRKFIFIFLALFCFMSAEARNDWELLRYELFESTCRQLIPLGYDLIIFNDNDPKRHFVLVESQKRWTKKEEDDFMRRKVFIVNYPDKEIYVMPDLIKTSDNITNAITQSVASAEKEYREKIKMDKLVDEKYNEAKNQLRKYLSTLPTYSLDDPDLKAKVYALFGKTNDKVVQIVRNEKARQRAANDIWPEKYIDEYQRRVTGEVMKVNFAIAKKYKLENEFEFQ